VDPTGLALETRTIFEPVASGYLRPTGRILPAGANTQTSKTYYGDGEDRDNPCTTETDPADQGGQIKYDTAADPDGAGGDEPVVREYVYDEAGRNVAYRIGSDDWTCATYDARGRLHEVEFPAYG